MGIETAIIGSALLGAGASVASSRTASRANDRAVTAQTNAANDAADVSRDQLDYVKQINEPYQTAGVNALARLTAPANDILTDDPGYQFRLDQGQKALEGNLLARGMGMSGAQIRAGQDYSQGMASQEYSNAWNRLAGIAGLGAGANQSAMQGTTYANNGISNALGAAGQAAGNGAINSANISNNNLSNITGIAGSTMNSLAYNNAMQTVKTPKPVEYQ